MKPKIRVFDPKDINWDDHRPSKHDAYKEVIGILTEASDGLMKILDEGFAPEPDDIAEILNGYIKSAVMLAGTAEDEIYIRVLPPFEGEKFLSCPLKAFLQEFVDNVEPKITRACLTRLRDFIDEKLKGLAEAPLASDAEQSPD